MQKKFPYRRVVIVGCGGAGKSTLAVEMGERFGLEVVNLDKLWWLPNWQNRSEQDFDELLFSNLKKDNWIIEGNYARTFEMRLKYADFCLFLDYDTELCMQSVYERAEKYKDTTRPDMTEGCVEYVSDEFKDWIVSFKENVRPSMLEILLNGSTPYIIFQTRDAASHWLAEYD